MTEIIPNKLYLGDINDANDFEFLNKNKITTIITAAHNCEISVKIQQMYKIHVFEIIDRPTFQITPFFQEIASLIEREQCVLIHCYSGISRSPTCVIAYLMMCMNMTYYEAWKHVFDRRPCIKRRIHQPIVCFRTRTVRRLILLMRNLGIWGSRNLGVA